VLAHASGVKLAAIFSPEHGIAGRLDTTDIGNSKMKQPARLSTACMETATRKDGPSRKLWPDWT